MHTTLKAIASQKLDLRKELKQDINVNAEGKEYWYGLNLPNKLPKHQMLQNAVKPIGEVVGWFGYQAGKRPATESQFGLALWLYCGSPEAAKGTHAFLQARLGKSSLGLLKEPQADNAVAFNSADNATKGDKEWFEEVFGRLQG